jgi:hypothetical protein
MKKRALVVVALALLGAAAVLSAQTRPYDKYLTTADIEKASGLKGLKPVPYDPSKGAGGNLNFGLADGTVVLIASFQSLQPKDYDKYKTQIKSYVKGPVAGLADEAFNGPPGDYPYFISFRKGNWVATITTFFNPAKMGQTFLTMDQVLALCKVVAGGCNRAESLRGAAPGVRVGVGRRGPRLRSGLALGCEFASGHVFLGRELLNPDADRRQRRRDGFVDGRGDRRHQFFFLFVCPSLEQVDLYERHLFLLTSIGDSISISQFFGPL